MTRPLVSVVIPAFNSGRYLVETLQSVFAQTHPHRQVIVVDDGSTDGSVERAVASFPSVRCIRQENAGGGAARGAGLALAEGDFVAFLDHDDVWAPDKLAVQLAVAARHPESGLIACDGLQCDAHGKILRERLLSGPFADAMAASPSGEHTVWCYRYLFERSPIACPGQTLIPRRVIERVGTFSASREEATDIDYYMRIAREYPFTFHHHQLVRYRYLPGSHSGPMDLRWLRGHMLMLPAFQRQLRLCRQEDRAFVQARVRALTREVAYAAYVVARRQDPAFGTRQLARLRRLAPEQPAVWLYSLALHLPGDWAARLARLARAAARLARLR